MINDEWEQGTKILELASRVTGAKKYGRLPHFRKTPPSHLRIRDLLVPSFESLVRDRSVISTSTDIDNR